MPWLNDCHFEYTLSYKAASNGSNEKEYIGTLRCLEHTYQIHLNPFSFKVHETGTIEYQTEEMWVDCYEPAVVIGDQSAGLISAVNTLGSVPHSQLQFCNWHAVQAMKAKFTKSEYSTEELYGFTDGEVEIPGLIDHAWAYVESDTVEALGANRATLMACQRFWHASGFGMYGIL